MSPDGAQPAAAPGALPTVSVCMPAHRDSAYFRAALASVLTQSYADLEVIVGDDSGGALEQAVLDAGDDRVRYVANPTRLGFAGNHAATLDAGRGEYLAILHDDDLWHAGYLEQMVAALDADPELGLACSDLWEVFPDGRRQRPGATIRHGRHDDWLELAFDHAFFVPTTTVLRRATWHERPTKVWPDYPIGDVVLWIDAAAAGIPLFWVAEALAEYRRHDEQISGQLATREAQIEIFSSYSFPDRPEVERLRLLRVGGGYIGRAGARLRSGDAAGARADLAGAQRSAPGLQTRRRRLLGVLAAVPAIGVAMKLRARLSGGGAG